MQNVADNIDSEIIATLRLSIQDSQILMPDICVAEIIDYQKLEQEDESKPGWYLGQLPWRGLEVPLISLESMNHQAFFTKTPTLKIVVINALYDLKVQGFWAFVALDTPKLQRLDQESLASSSEEPNGEVMLMTAEIMGDEVVVPDLAKIEAQILAILD